MQGRPTIWFPLALLALLATLTLWIDHTVQAPQPKLDGSSRHDPDYKVTNFSTKKNDLNGDPRFVLSAVELVHYPDDDSALMTRPRFTQYSSNKPYTQIQGQRGQVSSGGDDVYFMDQVQVVRAASPERGAMTLLTEYLHLIPDDDIAVTNRPVTIRQAPTTLIRGSGMEYNKKERTLKVSGRVYVHYEKPAASLRAIKHRVPIKRTTSDKMAPAIGRLKQAEKQKNTSTTSPKKSAHYVMQPQTKTGKDTSRIRRTL